MWAVIALGIALSVVGCGDDTVRVPDLVGVESREAQERLEDAGLRWSYGDGGHVESEAPPEGVGNSLDDIPITRQKPSAGTEVEGGTVIVLRTKCARRHPCQ